MTRMQKWLVLFNIRVSENVSSTYSSILEFNLHKQTVYIMLLCTLCYLLNQYTNLRFVTVIFFPSKINLLEFL